MTNTKTLLKAFLGATALTVFATGTAQAQNNFTPADTPVTNSFTLDYKVGGVDQPQIDTEGTPDETVFTVDRLVDVLVSSQGDLSVAPGATDEELVFSVLNEGNATQAYELTLIEEPTAGDDTINTDDPASGTDSLVYYKDDGDGVFQDTGADGLGIPYDPANLPEVDADQVLWVVVTQDIPTSAIDGDQADLTLVANTFYTVADGGTGEVFPDTGGNEILGAAENVLADDTGTADGDNDGAHSATGAYIIASAEIEGEKTVTIYNEDGVGLGCATIPGTPVPNSYSIPGACVEYVISVTNTGSQEATDIIVEDTLPDELEYSNAVFGGDFTGGTLSVPLTAPTDCISGACVINLTGATLPAPVPPATSTIGTVTIRAILK